MALLEAMSWAVPVVASDVPGNRDLVRDGVTGRTYAHGDVEGLARTIALALSDPDAATLAEQARVLARERYGIDAMVAGYDAIYRQACEGRRRRAA
jgi:glycosyltransferase involved in cell wall biosynthesis